LTDYSIYTVAATLPKKLLTSLVISVYFVPVALVLAFYLIAALPKYTYQPEALGFFAIPIIFMLIVCALVIANIKGAVSAATRSQSLSFRIVLNFKLCLIPFYIVNFICWLISSMVFHLALFVLPLLPFVTAYTYITMIGTSAHVIAKLFTLYRNNDITKKQFVIHCILQLIFILDVFDNIYLAAKQDELGNFSKQQG